MVKGISTLVPKVSCYTQKHCSVHLLDTIDPIGCFLNFIGGHQPFHAGVKPVWPSASREIPVSM